MLVFVMLIIIFNSFCAHGALDKKKDLSLASVKGCLFPSLGQHIILIRCQTLPDSVVYYSLNMTRIQLVPLHEN